MYIDANVFVYAALDRGEKGEIARKIIDNISDGKTTAAISALVCDEVAWIVQKLTDRSASFETLSLIIELPLTWLDITYNCMIHALEYYKKGLDPRDALHLGIMKEYNINVIMSEDTDFDSVPGIDRWSLKRAISKIQ